jgi:hypothetical protein
MAVRTVFAGCAAVAASVIGFGSSPVYATRDSSALTSELELDTEGGEGAGESSFAAYAEAAAAIRSTGGMQLTMNKCPDRRIDNMVIGWVAVKCELLATSPENAYHCGLEAVAKDNRAVVRRYDLGPRPFQLSADPRDILAIAIECTEGAQLHGIPEGKAQVELTAPMRESPRGWTFAMIQEFIRTTQIVGRWYDLAGGNCQHFSTLLYEVMVKIPCHTIAVPNQDSIVNIMAQIGGSAGQAAGAYLQKFSAQFQAEMGVNTMRCNA